MKRRVVAAVPHANIRAARDERGDHQRAFVMHGGNVQGCAVVRAPGVQIHAGSNTRCNV